MFQSIPLRSATILAAAALFAAHPPIVRAQAGERPTCDGEAFRQFDFWVGDWDVTVNGKPAGTNLVTLEEGRCVVHEHWKGAKGGTGQSFNFYDRQDGKWHQVWVANDGSTLFLTGGYENNVLTLAGTSKQEDGSTVLNRISFRNNPDHSVRQLWETSPDGGVTWTAVFDGLYKRRSG